MKGSCFRRDVRSSAFTYFKLIVFLFFGGGPVAVGTVCTSTMSVPGESNKLLVCETVLRLCGTFMMLEVLVSQFIDRYLKEQINWSMQHLCELGVFKPNNERMKSSITQEVPIHWWIFCYLLALEKKKLFWV